MAADPVQEIDRFLNDDNNELARMDIDGAAAAAQPLARADGAIGPAQQEAGANQPVVPQAAVAAAVPEHQAEAAGAPLQQGQNRRKEETPKSDQSDGHDGSGGLWAWSSSAKTQ
ncbi:hypothetical protein QAD02_000794 [Eretmocerus hayati]|uniref:Uncharacterized protein n=1 Tax=Eretmocerus hayati TaxID=131215 RepID=A0ACC2NEA1_9HYME|nr:hypothetical protein QAD02_000794 [Eretmocerus hayati]